MGDRVSTVLKNHAAMQVVTRIHCSPLVSAERRKNARVVEFIGRARDVSPNGALQFRGVSISLRVWVVDTHDELKNGVGIAFLNGALFHSLLRDALAVFFSPRPSQRCCHQSRVLEIEHAVYPHEFGVIGDCQEIQRTLQSGGQSVRGHDLLAPRKSISVSAGQQEIAHRLGIR